MEPISAASAIGKLLSTGYSIYKAVQGHGADFELDLKAYESLIELGGQLGSWLPKEASAKEGAQALAVLTLAFGKAFHDCFGTLHGFDDPKRLRANLDAAVAWAQPAGPPDRKKPPLSLPELLAEPEKTPYFASLWAAFTQRNLPGKAGAGDIAVFAAPLIDAPSGDDRRRFETAFRRNVAELLASPGARDLSVAVLRIDQAAERARWVERLLVGDMATWHLRHVFANVRSHGHDTLPPMPLGTMYVEPWARLRSQRPTDSERQPIRTLLRSVLQQHPLVVVTADFGHGKSLTARTLAYEVAQAFLNHGSQPSAELERPVFVKCQTAFSTSNIELAQAVRRAQWLTLRNDLGIGELSEADKALSPPSARQRTLFLLDGLDEVAFLERDGQHFFEHLRGQLSTRHRAVVFSRPHSLPAEQLADWGVPVLQLEPFDTDGDDLGQAGQWLTRWNACSGRPPIAPSDVRSDGLHDLAGTPILLFMIAYTWGNLQTLYADWEPPASPADDTSPAPLPQGPTQLQQREAAWDRKHRIYEAFFRAIAWGKFERDRDAHPVIRRAARALHSALVERSLVPAEPPPSPAAAPDDVERRELTQAMLWLMARVAWHAACLSHQPKPKPLTRSQVDRLLEDELDLTDPKSAEVARDGLLLAMQADLSESSRPILFGHQSFREFLIARCWSDLLRVCVDPATPEREAKRLTGILRAAPLREEDAANFAFLRARLRQWPPAARQRLLTWALAEFENDALETTPATLRRDTRRDIRTTALALACTVAPAPGLALTDPSALRSLLASYWVADEVPMLWAPRLQAPALDVPGADLRAANLEGANLAQARLPGVDLHGAYLQEANLQGATLDGAKLFGATLSGAYLQKANLIAANLVAANLVAAKLQGAHLQGATLFAAVLEGAHLQGAHLQGAYLQGAHLEGADLEGADLQGADLEGAYLQGAHLQGANLERANLFMADLRGARLGEAGYAWAVQSGAVVDASTQIVRPAAVEEEARDEREGAADEGAERGE
ncbi:MAG: pentapeptide repeat-containing protein [Myxococcales bacterium]|nr:pentapeptide repeat-containing protein [Myxococcales bacterium]